MKFLPKFRGDFDLDRRSRARSRGRSGERLLGRRSPLVSILPMTLFHHHNYFLILVFEKKNQNSKRLFCFRLSAVSTLSLKLKIEIDSIPFFFWSSDKEVLFEFNYKEKNVFHYSWILFIKCCLNCFLWWFVLWLLVKFWA